MNRLLVVAAGCLILFGGWRTWTTLSPTSDTDTTDGRDQGDNGEGEGAVGSDSSVLSIPPLTPPSTPRSGRPSTTARRGVEPDQSSSTPSTVAEDGFGEPSWHDGSCEANEAGWGVGWKAWGRIDLPYANQWPTNQPGQPVDCAPNTEFGMAINAAHTVFLQAFRPELINQIAVAGRATTNAVTAHEGGFDPAQLDMGCRPLGWSKQARLHLFYQCDDQPVQVAELTMVYDPDNSHWLLVFNADGSITQRQARTGEAYLPFESGE